MAFELREPFSYMGHTRGGTLGARSAHPLVQLGWTLALLGLATIGLRATVPMASHDMASRVALVPLTLLLIVGGFSLYVALSRLAWLKRVKHVTGMSPFAMARLGIEPAEALARRSSARS